MINAHKTPPMRRNKGHFFSFSFSFSSLDLFSLGSSDQEKGQFGVTRLGCNC